MDYFLIAAILLMVLGIAGSLIPVLPGVVVSMAGVLLYWWSTGFTEPGNVFIAITVFLGVTSMAFDWIASSMTAKAGGASDKTSVAAGVAGFLGFFIGGPVGVVVAAAVAVFIREYFRTGDVKKSRKAGIYAAFGIVASVAFKVFVSIAILLGFLITILI